MQHQIRIMQLLKERTQSDPASAIAALHDVNLAARYCSHVVMLFGNGAWSAGTTDELITEASLERLYGCAIESTRGKRGIYFHPAP